MRVLEEQAFATGSSPEALMEKAGREAALAIQQFFPTPGRALVFFGKGHNGGDVLVAARYLREAGWSVELRAVFPSDAWSALTRCKHAEFAAVPPPAPISLARNASVILDGLLGIGVQGGLRDPIRAATREINQLRQQSDVAVFAMDLPTGLNGDTGVGDVDTVRADYTLTVGAAKQGLLADGATKYVGRLAVLGVEELVPMEGEAEVATAQSLAPLLGRRCFDTHKGNYGRVGIIAGSTGLTGAALMCSHAAVRAGAGLVTLYVSSDIYPVVAAAAAPEVMVHPTEDLRQALNQDALAIGPGLGFERADQVLDVVRNFNGPMVVDADALTLLSRHAEILKECAGPRLLTPHPGEMRRLMETEGLSRREVVTRFCGQYPVALLLKGARTLVGQNGSPFSYNSTGSPGMASGGMGDVLSGVCAALLGQGVNVYDTGRLGAWLCGRAAELALGQQSVESLVATDLLQYLGAAFGDLRLGCY